MGEIKRAVLEQSCQVSRIRFYSARLAIPNGLVAGQTRSTVTTFDKLGYFLLTSFYVGSTSGSTQGTSGFGLTSFTAHMMLQDLQTGKFLYREVPPLGGPTGNQVGSFATSQVELPEYPLFGPGERIGWTYTVGPFNPPSGSGDFVDICYSGIEYLMPGAPNGPS